MLDQDRTTSLRTRGIAPASSAPPVDIPPGHVGEFVIPGTGRRVWWVAPMGVGGGIARVFVDGTLAATVDLSETPTGIHRRQTAFQKSWPAVGHHTIKIVVGTRVPRVDVDAFAVSNR